MFITDKKELEKYHAPYRLWQGIPGIEVTKGGRIFITFYSGGLEEEIGNYVVLIKSDDGVNFSEPIAVAFKEGHRCYDPCLWIDPLGRLWFIWSYAPDPAVYAVICDNPDADELSFSEIKKIGTDVMMNKPTVLSTGEWLFPITVWHEQIAMSRPNHYNLNDTDRKAFAYKTSDNGSSFTKCGGVNAFLRSFDEHMILELKNGTLAMYIRTHYGIAVSYSYDRGKTWTEAVDSLLGGPESRFHIRRLKSGRILLVNHYNIKGQGDRSNLTAMLSEDDGKTWPYKLLLDERSSVSYPDVKEADDGFIYITYDRERGSYKKSLEETYADAREILFAKITENDIMEGKLINKQSDLKLIATKLGKYALEYENPFDEAVPYSADELTEYLLNKSSDEILSFLFNHYSINCINMHKIDNEKLDSLIEKLSEHGANKKKIIGKIVALIQSVTENGIKDIPIVERIKGVLSDYITEDISLFEIAQTLGISMYYMCHLFKKTTGITILAFKKEMKLTRAKDMLIHSDKKITDIAQECGFGSSSYFSKQFLASEKISPGEYRKLLKDSSAADKDVIFENMLKSFSFLDGLDVEQLEKTEKIKSYPVAMPDETYNFLHEGAIIKFKGRLFAAWYNNGKIELYGETPIRFATSDDDGKTWSEPETIATDKTGKILYCPPVFSISDGKLYMFLNQMVSADHMHSLDLYIYDEKENQFNVLWSRPVPFKLNTNTYALDNGKLIMPGRLGELDEFPNTPAAIISDSGNPDSDWRIVKMQENGNLADGSKLVHPEISLITDKEKIYAFTRNDERIVPLLYISEDYGESWSGPYTHDIPIFSACKTYSGTLSDGRNYLIGNIGRDRNTLAIFFSRKGKMKFNRGCILQKNFSTELGFGQAWHYPCAYEADGKLYVVYTSNVNSWNERGLVISVIDLSEV